MPLAIQREQYTIKYACRVLTIPNHPFRETLLKHYPQISLTYLNKIPPISARIFKEFISLPYKYKDIPTILHKERYKTHKHSVGETLNQATKQQLTPNKWRSAYMEMMTKYPNHTQVFCDGSVMDNKTGSAVWSEKFSIIARLPSDCSIFTAELYSILLSLKFIENQTTPTIILTDSLSSIQALSNPHKSKHHLVLKIANLLSSYPIGRVTVEWVPSHVGIEGNENADKLAKAAINLTEITATLPSLGDILRKINKFYISKWQQQWSSKTTNLKTASIGSPPAYSTMQRHDQVVLARLNLGVTKLTHSHLFNKQPFPICQICNLPRTITHILVVCPKYQQQRMEIISQCRTMNKPLCTNTILSKTFPQTKIIKYLHNTNLYSEI